MYWLALGIVGIMLVGVGCTQFPPAPVVDKQVNKQKPYPIQYLDKKRPPSSQGEDVLEGWDKIITAPTPTIQKNTPPPNPEKNAPLLKESTGLIGVPGYTLHPPQKAKTLAVPMPSTADQKQEMLPLPPRARLQAMVGAPSPATVIKPHAGVMPAREVVAKWHLAWPVKGEVVQSFGQMENGKYHEGIGIASPVGTPVHAAESGVVVYSEPSPSQYGHILILSHEKGYLTVYGHVEAVQVRKGDVVHKGDVIAQVGQAVEVDRPQLYFSVRKGKVSQNPLLFLEATP